MSRGVQLRGYFREKTQTIAPGSHRRCFGPTNIRWMRCVILGSELLWYAPRANGCCELVNRNYFPANNHRQSNNFSPLPQSPDIIAKLGSSRSVARACTSCRMALLRENRLACGKTLIAPTSCRNLTMLATKIAAKKPGYVALSGKGLAYCATCSNLDLQRVG